MKCLCGKACQGSQGTYEGRNLDHTRREHCGVVVASSGERGTTDCDGWPPITNETSDCRWPVPMCSKGPVWVGPSFFEPHGSPFFVTYWILNGVSTNYGNDFLAITIFTLAVEFFFQGGSIYFIEHGYALSEDDRSSEPESPVGPSPCD